MVERFKQQPQVDSISVAQEGSGQASFGGFRMTRRDFGKKLLRIAGALGLSSFLPGTVLAAEGENGSEPSSPNTDSFDTQKTAKEIKEKSEGFDYIDYSTAALIVEEFLRNVIYNGAIKGGSLGPKTALEMNLLAGSRIFLLQHFGGEAGKELAHHELEELKGGLLPLPALVFLSDLTSQALKVDPNQVFSSKLESAIASEIKNSSSFDLQNPNRPGLNVENLAEWKAYLENANKSISERAAQTLGATAILAPIGTTYASSAVGNQMKQDMTRLLFEQSLAQFVIERLNSGNNNFEINDLFQEAIQRADKFANGRMGFSALVTTLSANVQGACGVGDPPEVYFAINHPDGETLLNAHSLGLITSEVFTTILTAQWLFSVGVLTPESFATLFSAQAKIVKSLLATGLDSDLRGVSIRGGRGKALQKLQVALEGDDDTALKAALNAIPNAHLQMDFTDYLRRKLEALNGVESALQGLDLSALGQSVSEGEEDIFAKLQTAFQQKDKNTIKELSGLLEKKQKSDTATRVAKMMKDAIEAKPQQQAGSTTQPPGQLSDAERVKLVELRKELKKLDGGSYQSLFDLLGQAGEMPTAEKVMVHLKGNPSPDTLKAAMTKYTGIGSIEKDAVPGLERFDAGTTVQDDNIAHEQKVEQQQTHEKLEAIFHAIENNPVMDALDHNAKEVLWALLTQIPSVPAMIRVAKLILPKLVGIEEGNPPTPDQLKLLSFFTLTIAAGKSGLADNVAAYLFSEGVLVSFFERTYGPEVLTDFPDLFGKLGTLAVKGAEIAGSLTKVGNGPNFSQKKYVALIDPSHPSGIRIDEQEIPMGETIGNVYALEANFMYIGGASLYLDKVVDGIGHHYEQKAAGSLEVSKPKDPAEAVDLTRRELFTSFLQG